MEKKRRAVFLSDISAARIGIVLMQLKQTNPGLFDEAIIYHFAFSSEEQALLSRIMPCRFIIYDSPLTSENVMKSIFKQTGFKRFSPLIFSRFDMFRYLKEFDLVMWIDTDILLQGSLSDLLEEADLTGFAIYREDPKNKSAFKEDYTQTNFNYPIEGYDMHAYLLCSGLIIITRTLKVKADYTKWLTDTAIELLNKKALRMLDQGVINLLVQEFDIPIIPIGHHGKYGCWPYPGRNCSDAVLIHAWGPAKFWNDWYLFKKFPEWEFYHQEWIDLGGEPLFSEFKPKISVLMPMYQPNIGYLKQCVDSILDQRQEDTFYQFTDYEVLIIAEPFNKTDIERTIQSYQDPRLVLIFNDDRKGIASSLNRGLQLAQGRYIARMDDDDISAPSRFLKQSEYLDAHPDIVMCVSDYEYFGDMREGRIIPEGELSHAWSVLTCPFDHPTVMFRKEFFEAHGLQYDENRKYAEDWDLWLRAFERGMTVGCIHEPLLYHRWHNGSAGQTEESNDQMKLIIQNNFRKFGIEIPWEYVPVFSPWWGKAWNEDALKYLKDSFTKALDANHELKLYDQSSLERTFELRMTEAETGVLPEMSWNRYRDDQEKSNQYQKVSSNTSPQKSKFRILIKNLLRPLYQPFRHRYEDRLIDIQRTVWEIHCASVDEAEKLSQIISLQEKQIAFLTDQLAKLSDNFTQLRDVLYSQAETTRQELFVKVFEQAEDTRQTISSKVFEQAENTRQMLSGKVFEQAEATRQTISSKVFEQAENTRQMLSGKVFEQAEATRQTISSKVFEQAENTRQELSAKIFTEAENTRGYTENRIWKTEQSVVQEGNRRIAEPILDEIHRHIDFTYRDIMIALQRQHAFLPENNIKLETDYPVAYESLDHLNPHGTIRDNTRYPRFVEKCETLLAAKKQLAFLDLGCSGGGMVLEAALRGHLSIGLEGSDCSKIEQRAEWRLLGDRLQTCDITKPFFLRNKEKKIQQFDIITAWEVLEHIAEADLPQLLENIRNHLAKGGYFVGSIANWNDIDAESGINWHITVHPYDWWKKKFMEAGFQIVTENFAKADLARGGYNPPHCYEKPYPEISEKSLYIAVQK